MQPTDDKHEQRLEPEPSVVLKVATALAGVMIVGLAIFGLWELGR